MSLLVLSPKTPLLSAIEVELGVKEKKYKNKGIVFKNETR